MQYEARKKLFRFHKDPLLSLVLRERVVAASDAAATPAADLAGRLWLGDVPPLGLTVGSEVVLLMMKDECGSGRAARAATGGGWMPPRAW